ncbi:MAG: UbiA family prenyltransferase [Bacteroidia bacterium]|nr:UbiA family prenyltransferase [Bacteroidia bacterium]
MIDLSQNNAQFLKRFWIYLGERFPLQVNGILISIFTFSAISYSRICRGAEAFIALQDYLVGIAVTVSLFLLLRIFDEFKDKEDDALYRTYLPVPRGLISLQELRWVGIVLAIIQLGLLIIFQLPMLWLYMIVLVYMLLMAVEFFIPQWLKKHQIAYITSHMFIIPLVDVYSTGLDWVLEGVEPSHGLAFFFLVSYLNGMVLEFGRKIRAPEKEEKGVVSYTSLYGTEGGTIRWLLLLTATLLASIVAAYYANFGLLGYSILTGLFVLCSVPGFLFLSKKTEKLSKFIEYSSGLWTAGMYLSLGAIPMLNQLISGLWS